MLDFLKNLMMLNMSLAGKVKGVTLYNDAMALCQDNKYREALPILQQAAEMGNADAMAQLGAMHMLGQGVHENNRKAATWLEMAVKAGHKSAVGTLGMLLATGKGGVERDMDRAIQLMKQAAEDGDTKSERMLEMIEKEEGMFATAKHKTKRG